MTEQARAEKAGDGSGGTDSVGRDGTAGVAAVTARQQMIDRIWMVAVTGLLYALLFREELIRLLDRWTTARESHGLLIPAFSLYFLYRDRARLRQVVGRASYWGLVVILASVAGYMYAVYVGMYYPRHLMMLTLLAGVVLLLGGWRVLRVVWLPVVFLIFAMPLPARLYYQITMPMRELASLVAAAILNVMPGVHAEASGVLIHGSRLGQSFDLNVAEACSGMRLLLAFLALGVAMAYLEYRPAVHRAVLLCSTIPIAIFCNMLRVLITGVINVYLGPEYAVGMLHTLLGMAMLAVAFGLYGLLAWLMNRLFLEEEEEGQVLVVRPEGTEKDGCS